MGSYCALHCIFGSGQDATCTAGQAGQGLGSGQLASGHLGRGQGGHSPILQGLLQVLIHGGHLGTDDFKAYLDISGCAGHSVLSMYRVISGIGGQGGIVDFNTYLVASGTGQGACGGFCSGRLDAKLIIAFCTVSDFLDSFSQEHFLFGIWQVLQLLDTAGRQPHCGLCCPQILHIAIAKPSSTSSTSSTTSLLVYFPNRYPPSNANTATNTNAEIVYENLLELNLIPIN